MSWSSSRQLFFGSIFVIVVALLIGVPVYFMFFNRQLTCTDGRQGPEELGVDCGGVCTRACVQEVVKEPIVLWSRAFPISTNTYNLVAYVQNPNISHIARPTRYSFKLFDADNVLIATREGATNIPSIKSFPIFEQGIFTDQRIPVKVVFTFEEPIVWEKYSSIYPELVVNEPILKNASSTPRIDARVSNKTLNRYENTEVLVIVYGADDNAIAVSRTFIPVLESRSEMPVVFTWPLQFKDTATKIEIIPKLAY